MIVSRVGNLFLTYEFIDTRGMEDEFFYTCRGGEKLYCSR